MSSSTSTQRLTPPAGRNQNLNQSRNQSNPCVKAHPSVTRIVNPGINQVNHQVAPPPVSNQVTKQDSNQSKLIVPPSVSRAVSQNVNYVNQQVETNVNHESMNQSSLKVTPPPPVTRIVHLDMNQVNHQVVPPPGNNQCINQSSSQVTRVIDVNMINHQVTAHPTLKQNQQTAVVDPRYSQRNFTETQVSNGPSRCAPAVSTRPPNVSCAGNTQQTVNSYQPVCSNALASSSASGNKIRYIPPAVINHTAASCPLPTHQRAVSRLHTWVAPVSGVLNNTERAPQNPKVHEQFMMAGQLAGMTTAHGNGCHVITVTIPSQKKLSPQ